MNFSGISNQTFLGKVLRFPLRLMPPDLTVPILQGQLQGKRWIVGSSNHGCWLGSYEFEKQQLFKQTLKPGSIVFDLGAYVGFYTLLASELVGKKGKVFAFEPIPRNLFYLKKHLELNQINNVTIIESAVSNCRGVASFDAVMGESMGFFSSTGRFQVKTVSLDELIQDGEIPIPDYLKIDVEGAELLVLEGAKTLLNYVHPTIFLATHTPELHQQCCQLLTEIGYQLQPIGGKTLAESDEMIAYFNY